MTKLFIPKENRPGETRVAATPDSVNRLKAIGLEIFIEHDAGTQAGYLDSVYEKAGAQIVSASTGLATANIVARINPPTVVEIRAMQPGAIIVSFLWPAANPDLVFAMIASKITAFAMDRIPRITRAQSMDALSSQANIAGYKAALVAADHLPRLMPMLMTAAGTLTPAKVVVMGAGVAGLQAVATAKRLGAVVEVSDVRASVKEQVESLGARFITVEGADDLEGKGGYAREASPEFLARQKEIVRKHVVSADAVITTALVPGRKAPVLVTADMVSDMKPGSVIVDLAVDSGGNCELSQPGQVIEHHGVKIVGWGDLPARVPTHSSDVYSRNISEVLKLLHRPNQTDIDFTDEILNQSIVVHSGAVRAQDISKENQ